MKIKEIELDDELNLAVIETRKFKNNFFSMSMVVKADKDMISKANLLANVISRGCNKYKTNSEIKKHCNMMYNLSVVVSANLYYDNLEFNISCVTLQDKYAPCKMKIFEQALQFVRDLVFDPLLVDGEFNADYVETEKRRLCDAIESEKNNKRLLATRRCVKEFYDALHPIGYIDIIKQTTSKDLKDTFDYLCEKARIYAVFVGDYSENIQNTIENHMSILFKNRNKDDICSLVKTKQFVNDKEFRAITEEVEANQSSLVLGYTINSTIEKIAPRMLFDCIFGGMPTSKLFTNVRERLNLCYYCYSRQMYQNGVMLVNSGISYENLEKVTNEVAKQLNAMSDEDNISDEEMDSAKKMLISGYLSNADSFETIGTWYLHCKISDWYTTDIDRIISDIKAVTKSEICDIAKNAKLEIQFLLKGMISTTQVDVG